MAQPSPDHPTPRDPRACPEQGPSLPSWTFSRRGSSEGLCNLGASLLCSSVSFLYPFFHEIFKKVLWGGQGRYYLPSFFRCGNQGLRMHIMGFPGGAVVGSLPASAGDMGSSPGLGGSHMPQSGWAREPQLLSLRVWSLCSTTGEAAMVRGPRTAMKSGLCLPQLEKALAQKRRPNTAINKLINF